MATCTERVCVSIPLSCSGGIITDDHGKRWPELEGFVHRTKGTDEPLVLDIIVDVSASDGFTGHSAEVTDGNGYCGVVDPLLHRFMDHYRQEIRDRYEEGRWKYYHPPVGGTRNRMLHWQFTTVHPVTYRGYELVQFSPPGQPHREAPYWRWQHPDYDGPEDKRQGTDKTILGAFSRIDELEDEE